MNSLNRHGISVVEVDYVLEHYGDTKEQPPSKRGNNRTMFIGFTLEFRLLEVGVEYFYDQDREHIYHANDARQHFQELLRRVK
jgi:hypothetical protein